LEEPEVWGVETFTKDALTMRVAARTAPLRQWEIARALREQVRAAFVTGELAEPGTGEPLLLGAHGAGTGSDVAATGGAGRPTGPTGSPPSS
jgi:hypothetical protein